MPKITRKTVGGLTFVNVKAFGAEWSLSYCRKTVKPKVHAESERIPYKALKSGLYGANVNAVVRDARLNTADAQLGLF